MKKPSWKGSPIVIGKNVYIGEKAVILPQVERTEDYAIIAAFAVVTKNVAYGEIWAGNPAKKIGERK